jgi:glutamate dehydrogenase (NAD(P)+)
VTVSYFEQVQNLNIDQWKLEDVHRRLDERMTTAFASVDAMRQEKGVHPRLAAYLVSVQRVAEACELRGWTGHRHSLC